MDIWLVVLGSEMGCIFEGTRDITSRYTPSYLRYTPPSHLQMLPAASLTGLNFRIPRPSRRSKNILQASTLPNLTDRPVDDIAGRGRNDLEERFQGC